MIYRATFQLEIKVEDDDQKRAIEVCILDRDANVSNGVRFAISRCGRTAERIRESSFDSILGYAKCEWELAPFWQTLKDRLLSWHPGEDKPAKEGGA
jgi:hypothetical protein